LLRALHPTPFIVPIGGNEASPVTEGIPEGWLLGDGFRAGVDAAIAGPRLLGPVRDQAPVQEHELSVALRGVSGEQ
jgi:hypothetical protein